MPRKLTNEEIISLRQSGISPATIAKRAGLSRSRVSHIAPLKKRTVRIPTPDGLTIPYYQVPEPLSKRKVEYSTAQREGSVPCSELKGNMPLHKAVPAPNGTPAGVGEYIVPEPWAWGGYLPGTNLAIVKEQRRAWEADQMQILLNKQWLTEHGFFEIDGNWFEPESETPARPSFWQRLRNFFRSR